MTGGKTAMNVNFIIGDRVIRSTWDDNDTARRILAALPIEASGSYWGGEFYFEIPVKAPYEHDARDVVEPGAVAYWPAGRCLCIFWGSTPASESDECRAASKVNVVGRVENLEELPKLKARRVRVEAA
jgi:hypothetical protein